MKRVFRSRPTPKGKHYTGRYSYTRHVAAGCLVCHENGEDIDINFAPWAGNNAQALAARHSYATGHKTWCYITMMINYGTETKEDVPSTE